MLAVAVECLNNGRTHHAPAVRPIRRTMLGDIFDGSGQASSLWNDCQYMMLSIRGTSCAVSLYKFSVTVEPMIISRANQNSG